MQAALLSIRALSHQAAICYTPRPLGIAPHPDFHPACLSSQITAICWALLPAPNGSMRKDQYLQKGRREPEAAYPKRLDAARPSGFFRDALRIYAGNLGPHSPPPVMIELRFCTGTLTACF
mgnify:CR=1 FL=1